MRLLVPRQHRYEIAAAWETSTADDFGWKLDLEGTSDKIRIVMIHADRAEAVIEAAPAADASRLSAADCFPIHLL